MLSWLSPKRRPVIVAHRGSSGTAPENTLAAFRQAIDDGADAVELDIHLSKDGEVVVIHDPQLSRTTDGRGRVHRRTIAELRQLDAGRWFHKRFAGENIPTLSEVFEMLNGRLGVNIEIKGCRRRQTYDIVERCIRVVKNHRASKYVLISSFHHPFVKKVKILDPSIVTGVLYHPVRHARKSPHLLTAAAGAEFFICGDRYLRSSVVKDIDDFHIPLSVYSINRMKQFGKIMRIGTDCIVTDHPARIVRWLGR